MLEGTRAGHLVALLTLLALAHTQAAEDGPTCPSVCTCQGRPDGSRYKVECISQGIQDISTLGIPSDTTQLSITGNSMLTRIGKDDLSSLDKLDRLDLSGNSISVIEPGAFSNIPKLTKLDLSDNKLSAINNSMFTGLEQLKRLFITNNLVQVIEQDSFSSLTNIQRLSLSGNTFSTLPERVFSQLTQLSRIDFDSENLECDCRLEWLINWIGERGVNVLDTKCAQPTSLAGSQVKALTLETLQCERPVNLRVFELDPPGSQLVFIDDTLPIECKVSTDNVLSVNWYRNDKRVVTNTSAKIQVDVKRTAPGLVTNTLILRQLTKERTGLWTCVVDVGKTNKTKSISIFTAPASCPEVTVETNKGKYKWPRTGFKSRAELACKFGTKAYYTCNADAQWVDLDLKGCKYSSEITQQLYEFSLSNFNNSLEMVKMKVLMTTLMQSNNIIADKMDIIFVSRILRKISSSYGLYEKDKIPEVVYNITSLMMKVNNTLLLEAEMEEGACTSMRANLETVVSYTLEHRTEYSLYMDNIAMQARKFVPTSSFVGLMCTALQNSKTKKTYLSNNFYCVDKATTPDFARPKNQKVDALIHIPADAVNTVANPRALKLVTIIYRDDTLYQSNITGTPSPTSKYFVPSPVISVKIIDAKDTDLTPSLVTVALPRQDYVNVVPNVKAVYWDKPTLSWKNKGCRISNTVGLINHNLSIIECGHMATYALLQERLVAKPEKEYVEEDEWFVVQRPQFYVGAVFLCMCLLAVILTYTCSYSTIGLSKKLKHSLINTCLSVLFLKLMLILGVKTHHDIGCKVLGMSIHYFSLTTIFWMTVTTWNIYKKICGRGHRLVPTEENTAPLPPNPMLKFHLFAWGVPIIVCGITGAVNIEFYNNKYYCFVSLEPGFLAFYGVVGLFILVNCILYICICSSKRQQHTKVYMDEMMEMSTDGCLDSQRTDDNVSHNDSIKSSVADSEYKPLAQLTGIILFLLLYLMMWASRASSIALLTQTNMEQMEVILSYLYMILCIILGIFLVVFYCLARNDTRSIWQLCCKSDADPSTPPPRSNTNINVISRANAHNNMKQDDDSCSSLKASSANHQSNPLLQIMQYHKKSAAMMSQSMAGSQRADSSIHGGTEDGPVFFNAHQNGVAKRYWERKRTSRDRGLDSSMASVPETSRLHTHSPTNTEPTQHMSIEIQIKSHNSKQARRHRLGSTNSEPADVRNNIYHSMPKSPHQLRTSTLSAHNSRLREPTIGQSKTPSEGSRDTPQFYKYPPDMWQNSVPRNYNHMVHRSVSPHVAPGGYMKPPSLQYERGDGHRRQYNEQAYVHSGYMKSMRDMEDNSDDESHYSHRSRRSSHRSSRHRHHRQRQHLEAEGRQPTPSALNESHTSLQSHGTARSHHSSRSNRSGAHKYKGYRGGLEERPLLQMSQSVENDADDEEGEKLNINHSSSDNNSSHYACTPVQESKQLNNTDIQVSANTAFSVPQSHKSAPSAQLNIDLPEATAEQLNLPELAIPEERIYENAHKIMQHERPVYTNLEELRQRVAAKHSPKSPEVPPPDSYELPVYENLFSLNEYDTLRKQKHHVNKGLPNLYKSTSRDTAMSPKDRTSPNQSRPDADALNCDSSL